MANYLIRRNGRYSYRRRYPTEVAALILKSEFVKALGTADPKEAARLSRVVSVRFDSECDEALRSHKETSGTPDVAAPPDAQTTDENVATDVLASLPGVIRTMTHAVIAEQSRNKAGWQDALSWRRRGLAAHVAGEMPVEIQMHPLVAATALRAFDAASAGTPLPFPPAPEDYISTGGVKHGSVPSVPSDEGRPLTSEMLEKAIVEYSIDKSSRRQQVARRCVARSLKLPCTKLEAARQIADWCVAALGTAKKTSSVWTEASAVIALLKFVPTWHDFRVEKVGELRRLRGAGRANVAARASMQVSTLYSVLNTLPQNLPRDGDHWYAALLICALYGMRPGELLQSGPEALQSQRDVFGNERLVFKVGMRGAKNKASERDLPVSEELRPIFEQALRKGTLPSIDELNKVFSLNTETGELVRRIPSRSGALQRKQSISREYRTLRVNGNQYAEHRIIFVLANQQAIPDGMEVDHINLNKKDNRPANLRLVTRAQNMVNMQKLRNNTTGFKGVYYCLNTFRYRAQIGMQNTRRKLGSFYSAEEAGRAYDVAAIELFGEHALTNDRLGLFVSIRSTMQTPALPQITAVETGFRSYPGVPDMPLPLPRCTPTWTRHAAH